MLVRLHHSWLGNANANANWIHCKHQCVPPPPPHLRGIRRWIINSVWKPPFWKFLWGWKGLEEKTHTSTSTTTILFFPTPGHGSGRRGGCGQRNRLIGRRQAKALWAAPRLSCGRLPAGPHKHLNIKTDTASSDGHMDCPMARRASYTVTSHWIGNSTSEIANNTRGTPHSFNSAANQAPRLG